MSTKIKQQEFALRKLDNKTTVFNRKDNIPAELPLSKGLSLIIGNAGTGKSTLLNLMREENFNQEGLSILIDCFGQVATTNLIDKADTWLFDFSEAKHIESLEHFIDFSKVINNIELPGHKHIILDLSKIRNNSQLLSKSIVDITQYVSILGELYSNKPFFLYIDEFSSSFNNLTEYRKEILKLVYKLLTFNANVTLSLQSYRDFCYENESKLPEYLQSIYLFKSSSILIDWLDKKFYEKADSLKLEKEYTEFNYLNITVPPSKP